MKKTILLILLLLVSTFNTFSQDRGYLGLSYGPSFSIGDFGSYDLNNEKAGFAQTGSIFELAFAHKIGKYLGLTSAIRNQSNSFNVEPILTDAKNFDPTINWSAESKNWSVGGLFFGGWGSFPIDKTNVDFQLRVMGGLVNVSSAELTLSGSAYGITVYEKINSMSVYALGFIIGGGFKFNLGKKIRLLTTLDYFATSAKFEHVSVTSNYNPSRNTDLEQKIKTINLGIGLGLRL